MTRVMVVDDHPMWREAVARDLAEAGHEVVATAADGAEAVRRAPAARPDVVVLDLQLPYLSGVEVTRALVAMAHVPRILVLSASGEHADVLEAVKAGATGYLVKSASREELLSAVERTAQGEAVFTPGLAGLVLGEFRRLASGASGAGSAASRNRAGPDIPSRPGLPIKGRPRCCGWWRRACPTQIRNSGWCLAPHRAEPRVQNTLTKLQLHNRVELVRYAIEQGIDQPDPPA